MYKYSKICHIAKQIDLFVLFKMKSRILETWDIAVLQRKMYKFCS